MNLIGSEDAIVDDIFEFLIKVSNFKKDMNYMKTIFENDRKKKNVEDLKKNLLSIVENSVLGIRNLLIDGDDLNFFHKFLVILEKKFGEKDTFMSMLQILEVNLKESNINSSKLENLSAEIKNKLDKFW